jgi:D-arabinitol 4-dehydrogenase
MVERITPRPPPELAERVNAATGQDDRMPVTAAQTVGMKKALSR